MAKYVNFFMTEEYIKKKMDSYKRNGLTVGDYEMLMQSNHQWVKEEYLCQAKVE